MSKERRREVSAFEFPKYQPGLAFRLCTRIRPFSQSAAGSGLLRRCCSRPTSLPISCNKKTKKIFFTRAADEINRYRRFVIKRFYRTGASAPVASELKSAYRSTAAFTLCGNREHQNVGCAHTRVASGFGPAASPVAGRAATRSGAKSEAMPGRMVRRSYRGGIATRLD